MARVLVLGAAAMDTVARVPVFPRADDIVYPDEVLRVPGGSAANVAVALARLGERVSFLGAIGADADGDALEAAFRAERVDVASLLRIEGGRTAGAFIAVDRSGERRMFSLGGDAVYTSVSQLDKTDFSCDALYVAEAFSEVGAEAALRARKSGAKVFFAPGGVMCGFGLEGLLDLVRTSDTMLLSEPELRALTGAEDVRAGTDSLFRAGAKAVVVTQGARGAGLYLPEGFVFVPPVPANVVDSTGAGDAFAGGYLFAELRGDSSRARLAFASRCAAFALGRIGARTSPRLEEIPS